MAQGVGLDFFEIKTYFVSFRFKELENHSFCFWHKEGNKNKKRILLLSFLFSLLCLTFDIFFLFLAID